MRASAARGCHPLGIHLHRTAAQKSDPCRTRQQQLDAVVHLIEKEGPVRPRGFQLGQQDSHLGDVHQLARVVVVAVHHQRHLAPVKPGVFAGSQKDFQACEHRSQVTLFNLAARDHQNDRFGDAGAQVRSGGGTHDGYFATAVGSCLEWHEQSKGVQFRTQGQGFPPLKTQYICRTKAFGCISMKRMKDETLSIRTSADIKQLLKQAAELEHRSVASMVEVLVLAYAQAHGLTVAPEALVQAGERKKKHGTD
jgi:uncharacterized protein (DUF1778 family)